MSSWWARCIGLRVWKATTRSQPRSANSARSSAGVQAQRPEVVVGRELDALERGRRRSHGCGRWSRCATPGCSGLVVPKTPLGLGLAVGTEQLVDVEDGEHDALGVAQRQAVALGQLAGQLLGTSRVIGIGQSVPSASRMVAQTALVVGLAR